MNGQVSKSFPQKLVSKNIEKDLPALKGERRQVYIYKHSVRESNQKIYNEFNQDINMYLLKLPPTNARKSVESVMKRDLVYIAKSVHPQKDGILGGVAIDQQDNILGLLVDAVDLNIDFSTGRTGSPDEVIYGIYFQHIRSIILTQIDRIRNDDSLHKMIIEYLKSLILRVVGKTVYLSDKQKDLLHILSSYIYYRFQLGRLHDESVEKSLAGNKELKEETQDAFSIASRYKTPNDLFIGLTDFKIIIEPPNKIIMNAIQLFRLAGYYSITTSIDYLIGFAIISKYPVDFFKNGLTNSKLIDNIENRLIKTYGPRVKYKLKSLG